LEREVSRKVPGQGENLAYPKITEDEPEETLTARMKRGIPPKAEIAKLVKTRLERQDRSAALLFEKIGGIVQKLKDDSKGKK